MISSAIIYFRESLEISLILGLIAVATKNIQKRNLLIIYGVVIGIICSFLLALSFNYIVEFSEGQEIFNASILSINVLLIIWTLAWVNQHSSSLSSNLKQIKEEKLPLYLITFLVASSLIREGMEIILFTYGLAISKASNPHDILIGSISGTLAGILVGIIIYFGFIKIKPKHFFRITNILLAIFAASMASQIPNFLANAGALTALSEQAWNSSWLLEENSTLGRILHLAFGYNEKPTFMQLIFYFATLITTFILVRYKKKPPLQSI